MRTDFDVGSSAAALMVVVDAVCNVAFDAGNGGIVVTKIGHNKSLLMRMNVKMNCRKFWKTGNSFSKRSDGGFPPVFSVAENGFNIPGKFLSKEKL